MNGVVGHVEWADFLELGRFPRAGEITHATAAREGAGGGGAMAARAMAALGGRCVFWTSLGRPVRELGLAGVEVRAQEFAGAQRRVVVLVAAAERTIVVSGERHVPRGPLDMPPLEGVYLCGGDAAAVSSAREAARALVVTPRAGDALLESGADFDVVVASAHDPGEGIPPELAARAGAVVLTEGAAGGSWQLRDGRRGRWEPAAVPGPVADSYGCGDAFAAALAIGLGAGRPLADAVRYAARAGAVALTCPAPDLAGLTGV